LVSLWPISKALLPPPSLISCIANTIMMGIEILGTDNDDSTTYLPESFSINGVSCTIATPRASTLPKPSPLPSPTPSTSKPGKKNGRGKKGNKKGKKGDIKGKKTSVKVTKKG